MNKKLYVIGNGFDLHHNLKTSYYSFAEYLKANNRELYDTLESYVSYPNNHNDLWWQFEDNLANLDADEILSENTDRLPDYASDEFRDRDRHVFPDIMQNYLELLTSGLIKSFTEFIQEVEYPESSEECIVELDINSLFLTFNYTKTLELLYGINKKKITYIHNSAFYGSEDIILGHGISPENFEEDRPEPPDDIEPEDYDKWYAENDDWEYSYDTGKEELWRYFELTFKPTLVTIQNNSLFFKSLKHIESIYILGHSISQIDLPYFVELVKSTNENVIWNVSFYNSKEKNKHLETLKSIGVKEGNIKQFELIDVQKNNRQLKLGV